MKILHVIPSLDPSKGGPSRSVIEMVRAQAALGADLQVVAGYEDPCPEHALDKVNLEFGLLALPRFGIPSFDLAMRIRRAVAEADLVHLHSIWTGTISYAGWHCRLTRKPTLLSPRGMLDEYNMRNRRLLKKYWFKLFERRNLDTLAGFHFQDASERQGCGWLGQYIEKPYLIQPNGSDIRGLEARFAKLETTPLDKTDQRGKKARVNLVFLGRLNPIKGLELQIELLADLREAGIDAHLHLIGPDDGVGAFIETVAARLGLALFLHLVGPIFGDKRLRWLKDADVVLLTSHYECNSNTALETIAVGGVLVATDTCHLDRPAQMGAACVVPRNRRRLFEATLELVTYPDKAQSIREAAINYAPRYLDWTAHAKEMLAFYEKLVRIG